MYAETPLAKGSENRVVVVAVVSALGTGVRVERAVVEWVGDGTVDIEHAVQASWQDNRWFNVISGERFGEIQHNRVHANTSHVRYLVKATVISTLFRTLRINLLTVFFA